MASNVLGVSESSLQNLSGWLKIAEERGAEYIKACEALNVKADSNRKLDKKEREDCSEDWKAVNKAHKELKAAISTIQVLLH